MTTAGVSDYWLYRAACGPADIAGAGVQALRGDQTATLAVWDYACEHWGADVNPFAVGESYLICTQTLYYLGRVEAVVGGFVRLGDASWVHWTGRLGTLLSRQKFGQWPSGQRKPRTERVGEVIVALGAVVSAYPWSGELPAEAVQ